jgi:tetratricopeptide (TPR) repeat protein
VSVPSFAVVIVLGMGLGSHNSATSPARGMPGPAAPSEPAFQTPVQPPRAAPSAADGDCDLTAYDCAVLSVERGDFGAAVAGLQQMLASAPRDLKALNLLGIALTGAGRIDEANARFREALSVAPGFNPARKNLAVNEFNAGRLAPAERRFNQVLLHAPDDEIAHLHLGEIHYARKQLAAAVPHYEKSGARLVTNPVWMLHYAACLLDQGQTARAVTILDQLSDGDASSRFEAGVALGRAGAYAEAARFFGSARSGYKDPHAAGYNQTLMLVEAGDHAAAIRVAEELFRQDLKSGELYNLISRAYVAADRIQDAYDALRTAVRLEPNEEQHYLDLALICLDHENFDLGLEIVDVGIRYRPEAPDLHLYRGVLLVMKGLVEPAEREFEQARTLGPDGPVPYVALAMAWMQSGNTPKAVDLLRGRMKASPRDAIVPFMFGVALMRSGVDPTDDGAMEAMRAFQDAIRLDPQLAGPRAELGKILLGRGDTPQAIEHLERAVALDPENAAPAYSLAQAYRRTGDTARAQELLARVSRLNAEGRGDDPDRELKRIVVRLVREGSPASGGTGR